MHTDPKMMWAARETCYMHVRREGASVSGTPFPQCCEAETQQPFSKKQLKPQKKQTKKTRLLLKRQQPTVY